MILSDYGFIRVGVAVPELQVANPDFNIKKIAELIKKANEKQVKVLAFPELSLTGYTASDLFLQNQLLKLQKRHYNGSYKKPLIVMFLLQSEMPFEADNQLFNTAVLFHRGKILGIVPKTFIPNYNEYYEKRWFSSSKDRRSHTVLLCGQKVPFMKIYYLKMKGLRQLLG